MHSKTSSFDFLSISLHWLIAVLTIGLFILGLWMVDLGYYDDWYYLGPWWHTGLGVFVFSLIMIRLAWRIFRLTPDPINSIPNWQQIVAKCVHQLLDIGLIIIAITGYFMVTAKGDSLTVFDWFSLPALILDKDTYVDMAGLIHLWGAYILMGFAALHALAALKHHFINKDSTLLRMIGLKKG